MAAKELTVKDETTRGQQVRSDDQLGGTAGFRIAQSGSHCIKYWDDGGCEPATSEETLMWAKLAEARNEIERLRTIAEKLGDLAQRPHYYCEDPWYSCPKAEGGCANEYNGDVCNCGADAHNTEVLALLTPNT